MKCVSFRWSLIKHRIKLAFFPSNIYAKNKQQADPSDRKVEWVESTTCEVLWESVAKSWKYPKGIVAQALPPAVAFDVLIRPSFDRFSVQTNINLVYWQFLSSYTNVLMSRWKSHIVFFLHYFHQVSLLVGTNKTVFLANISNFFKFLHKFFSDNKQNELMTWLKDLCKLSAVKIGSVLSGHYLNTNNLYKYCILFCIQTRNIDFFCCVAVIVGREPRGKNSSMQLHFLAQIKRFPGSFYRGGANGSFGRSAACCTYIRIGNWKCRHHVVKLVSPTVGYKWLLFFLIRGTDRRTAGAALYHTAIPSWYQINSNLSRWLEMLDITFRIY